MDRCEFYANVPWELRTVPFDSSSRSSISDAVVAVRNLCATNRCGHADACRVQVFGTRTVVFAMLSRDLVLQEGGTPKTCLLPRSSVVVDDRGGVKVETGETINLNINLTLRKKKFFWSRFSLRFR